MRRIIFPTDFFFFGFFAFLPFLAGKSSLVDSKFVGSESFTSSKNSRTALSSALSRAFASLRNIVFSTGAVSALRTVVFFTTRRTVFGLDF